MIIYSYVFQSKRKKIMHNGGEQFDYIHNIQTFTYTQSNKENSKYQIVIRSYIAESKKYITIM